MIARWIAILGLAAVLSACAHGPSTQATVADNEWNGGTWNSVLGYHGPTSAMVSGGPSR